MQSSAAVAGRALIMLACVVGIPALALSDASWSEMLKKLQDFRWPAILDLASASTSTSFDESPRLPPSTNAARQNATGAAPSAADPFHAIPNRLRQLGATYYLLESWGNEQKIFRFYCKMAVGGSTDYTRYFEATHSDPLQAMLQVLRQVETWREGGGRKAEGEEVARGQ